MPTSAIGDTTSKLCVSSSRVMGNCVTIDDSQTSKKQTSSPRGKREMSHDDEYIAGKKPDRIYFSKEFPVKTFVVRGSCRASLRRMNVRASSKSRTKSSFVELRRENRRSKRYSLSMIAG